VESRDGRELVKLEGAEAIQELQRVAAVLQSSPASRWPRRAGALKGPDTQLDSALAESA
jgi:hypothetical protein